jgi:hypothetical protein
VPALSNLERESWERDGFVIVPGFADGATCAALWERTVAISRTADAGGDVGDAQVLLEPVPDPSAVLPEEKVGKVFRLHHEPGVHADLAHDPGLGDLLDDRVGADRQSVLSDDELDGLSGDFVEAAVVAHDAGFAFVDVKACHGYLIHELLSGIERPGPFGGDLEGRTRFLRRTIEAIRHRVPGLAVGVRLSAFDLAPHVAGPDGTGVPEEGAHHAFGGDGTGVGLDLTEPDRLLGMLADLGVGMVCMTAGSPYYCPHAQRPAYFPPSDGYLPPHDPHPGQCQATDYSKNNLAHRSAPDC